MYLQHSHLPVRRLAAIAAGLGLLAIGAQAADVPDGIADPDVALADPIYRDPVFFWRMTSMPKDIYEPDAYFYWPAAVVTGQPRPWLTVVEPGRTTLPSAGLEAAAAWAEQRKTNALIIIHQGKVQLERYWNGMKPDELANGRALTRTITPMLLGFAIESGKLGLDDPLAKFITEWRDDPRGRITVRQLAQNVSGLEVTPNIPPRIVHGNKDLYLAYGGNVVRAAMNYPPCCRRHPLREAQETPSCSRW